MLCHLQNLLYSHAAVLTIAATVLFGCPLSSASALLRDEERKLTRHRQFC